MNRSVDFLGLTELIGCCSNLYKDMTWEESEREREETQVTDVQTKTKPELKCDDNNEASFWNNNGKLLRKKQMLSQN